MPEGADLQERFSMRKVLRRALSLLGKNAAQVAMAMVGPVLAMTVAFEILWRFGAGAEGSYAASVCGAMAVWLLLWIGFASVLRRRLLVPSSTYEPWRVLLWSRREIGFFVAAFKLLCAVYVPFVAILAVLDGDAAMNALLLTVLVAAVGSRLAMVLPAASLGLSLGLKGSFRLSEPARVWPAPQRWSTFYVRVRRLRSPFWADWSVA